MNDPRFKIIGLVVLAAAVAGGAAFADGGAQPMYQHSQNNRYGDDHQIMADHVSAVAALEPIGAVEGWGRAMVRDQLLPDGTTRRFLAFRVIGLEPDTSYEARVGFFDEVEESEVVVGAIDTDADGDGVLRLGWPEGSFPPVPDALPPADSLAVARVYDASLGLVLEGEFVIDWFGGSGPNDIVYLERIDLEPTIDPTVKGVAKVYRTEDDAQFFESRACRLEAEASYQVLVAGLPAGIVTTDSVGHGELVLSTVDGSLPANLQPIEELTDVNWVDGNGETVLSGTFSGEDSSGGHGGGVPPGNGNGDPGGTGGTGGDGSHNGGDDGGHGNGNGGNNP